VESATDGHKMYVIGGYQGMKGWGFNYTLDTDVFAFDQQKWEEGPDISNGRIYFAGATANDNLYILGGYVKGASHQVPSLLTNSPSSSRRWTEMPSMTTARSHHCAAAIGDKIYAVGGVAHNTSTPPDIIAQYELDTVEVFDTSAKKWTTLEKRMTRPRADFGLTAVNGMLYAVGGGGVNGIRSAERMNVRTGQWSTIGDMNVPRSSPTVVGLNGKIYAIGGVYETSKKSNKVEVYDPMTDEWTLVKEMSTARARAGAAVHDGKIYVFGSGAIQHGSIMVGTYSIEVYDAEKNEWSTLPIDGIYRDDAVFIYV